MWMRQQYYSPNSRSQDAAANATSQTGCVAGKPSEKRTGQRAKISLS
jgi:hypothetical protein